jgi:hypothetical protein
MISTGHSEILKPVVDVIGRWVGAVAHEWTHARTVIAQSTSWESGELLKYMRLATAACTYQSTALNFGSQLKMMKMLHELWDPNPEMEAQGTGWFGLRHLGHHIEVNDKRLVGKRMLRSIGRVQHATIELFRRLCTYGYAAEHPDEDEDEEDAFSYRTVNDIIYVIDKTAKQWPTYVPCVVVGMIGKTGDFDEQINNDDSKKTGVVRQGNKTSSSSSGSKNGGISVPPTAAVQYILRHYYEVDDNTSTSSASVSRSASAGTTTLRRRSKRISSHTKRKSQLEAKSDGDPQVGEREEDDDEEEVILTDDEEKEGEWLYGAKNEGEDQDDGRMSTNNNKRTTVFAGHETIVVDESLILSGRQFALEIGFHFHVITIYSEQVLKMKADADRINDEPHRECKLIQSCLSCLTACIKSKTMLRDVLNPKYQILKNMAWIMSLAVQGGSNMDPRMLTACWVFCHQILTSKHLRTAPNPSGGRSFQYEERQDSQSVSGDAAAAATSSISAVFVVRELTLAELERTIAVDVLHGVHPLLHFISDREPHYSRACVLLGPSSGALNIQGLRKSLYNMETSAMHELICSAVRLVRHFSILNQEKNAEDHHNVVRSMPIRRYRTWLVEVLDSLDDHRREQRLFDCLAVPNDDVRLCSIRCLGETPVGQFDATEISKLVHILLTMNGGDITAGETEYVLGEGFHLLTRLLLSVDGPEPRNFR